MKSEIENRADFNQVRYSQCWEDADILLEALDIKSDDVILSIASAGDNSFAMLAKNPSKIIAVDLSFEQIACCELRKVCYKYLPYHQFITFSGVQKDKPGSEDERMIIYKKIKGYLPEEVQKYWDSHMNYINSGFMNIGKFENYFSIFRNKVLPKVHNNKKKIELLQEKTIEEQTLFYEKKWNTFLWRMMFKVFFSRKVMGKLGRDPEFYKYVKTKCADRIYKRAEYALTNLSTHENPYLHYILQGHYNEHLPFALRPENFNTIKTNIDNIEFKQISVEDALELGYKYSCYNLSDIFEYMSQEAMDNIYKNIFSISVEGTRIAYWNMLVDRKCSFKENISYDIDYCHKLLNKDKAFFYSDFVLEKIIKKEK